RLVAEAGLGGLDRGQPGQVRGERAEERGAVLLLARDLRGVRQVEEGARPAPAGVVVVALHSFESTGAPAPHDHVVGALPGVARHPPLRSWQRSHTSCGSGVAGRAPTTAVPTKQPNRSRSGMTHDRRRRSRRAWAAVVAAVLAVTGAVVGAAPASAVPATIPLTITNDSGRGPIYLYVLGERDGVAGWADAGGTFHPWPGGVGPVPVPAPDASIAGPGPGQSVTIRLPKLSGRGYYSYGQKMSFQIVLDGKLVQPAVQNDSDPNRDILFNWTEYTLNDDGLWINSTQVDHWSAPYQVGVQRADGHVLSTGMLKPDGYQAFYTALESAGWGGLVQRAPDGSVLSALNPSHGIDVGRISSAAIDSYVTDVWYSYRTRDMVVTPFSHEPGTQFRGRVDGDWFRFRDGSGQEVAAFTKPDASSVYGCHQDLQAPNDH